MNDREMSNFAVEPEFDPQTGAYDVPTEGVGKVSTSVVLAIAEITDQNPLEMAPLYDRVDPELLDRIGSLRAETSSADAEITFTVEEHEVTVTSSDRIVIRPLSLDT